MMPPMNQASCDRSAYLSPANSGLPSFQIDMLTCIPTRCRPFIGLGMKVTVLPGGGDVVDDVFVFLDIVGLFGQTAEDHAQLVLAGATSWWCLSTLDAHALHGRQHLAADVLGGAMGFTGK